MNNHENPQTLKEFIAQFCKKNDVTISDIAHHACISRTTVYGMMGDTHPTIKNLCKLAVAMQVHPVFLINLEWQKCRLEGIHATPINSLSKSADISSYLKDNSYLVSENVPDGSLVGIGERFTKIWRLQNTGEVIWEGRKLVWQNPYNDIQERKQLSDFNDKREFYLKPVKDTIEIPTTMPSEIVELSVDMIAPTVPASAFSYWKMAYADGKLCYPNCLGVYAQVQVISSRSAHALIDSK